MDFILQILPTLLSHLELCMEEKDARVLNKQTAVISYDSQVEPLCTMPVFLRPALEKVHSFEI